MILAKTIAVFKLTFTQEIMKEKRRERNWDLYGHTYACIYEHTYQTQII